MAERRRLLEILRERSLRLGRFKLASGQESHYYFDAKLTTLHPEGAYLTARLVLLALRDAGGGVRAIGGLTLGADPIVAAVAAVSHREPDLCGPLQGFIVRKEAKGHGTEQWIEGMEAVPGLPVAVVDDVCTTGASTLRAIRAAEAAGLEVKAVLCVVDRQQGGAQALREYPFIALTTASELLDTPEIQQQLIRLSADPAAAP